MMEKIVLKGVDVFTIDPYEEGVFYHVIEKESYDNQWVNFRIGDRIFTLISIWTDCPNEDKMGFDLILEKLSNPVESQNEESKKTNTGEKGFVSEDFVLSFAKILTK